MKNAALLVCASILAACGSEPAPPPPQFQSARVEGLAVPGRISDAKAAGFTDCQADYYALTCKRSTVAPVFGVVPHSASLLLNADKNFDVAGGDVEGDVRDHAPEALSYREVVIELAPSDSGGYCDPAAPDPSSPSCQLTIQRAKLEAVLQAAGYQSWRYKSYTYYAKRGVPVVVTIGGIGRGNDFTISPATVDSIAGDLDREAQRKRAAATSEDKGQALVDGMKTPK